MNTIFVLLLLASIVCIVVGLIKPSAVIKWGDESKKTRGQVFLCYGISMVLCFILIGFTASPNTDNKVANKDSISEKKDNVEVKQEPTSKIQTEAEIIAETEAKVAAEAKAKAETEAKANAEAEANAAVESEAKAKLAAESKKYDPKLQNWNQKDLDFSKNGNLIIASEILQKISSAKLIEMSEEAQASNVMKAPWKYYGKVLHFKITAGFMQAYPPGSDESNTMANGKECAEVHGMTLDGEGSVCFFVVGNIDNINEGDIINIYGLPVGSYENENAYGGIVNEIVLIGKR